MSPKKKNIGRKQQKARQQYTRAKQRKARQQYTPAKKSNEATQTDDEPLAFNFHGHGNYKSFVDIGSPNVVCTYCQAKTWKDESKGFCCLSGKVQLPPLLQPPTLLMDLLSRNNKYSNIFLSKIRAYNSALAMTSIGCTEVRVCNFMPTFKISGNLYHRIGSLLPCPQESAKFLQIYFVGNDDIEALLRCSYSGTNEHLDLMKELQNMLHINHKYVKELKSTYEKEVSKNCSIEEIKIVIKDAIIPNYHERQTNAPLINEIAVIVCGHEESAKRDIIIEGRDDKLKRITETHAAYDPLQYPLLFPFGSHGYHIYMKQSDGKHSLSSMQFYNFRLMIRDNNYLLLFCDLLNQYIVDMYVKIEGERLLYCRMNQKKLRSEQYCHLKDSLQTDTVDNIGDLVILPSSHTGSPRYMCERMQDGMCYVRKYGTADLFITFTCNSKWKEITDALLPGQKAQNRYDIICRVFRLKLMKLKKLIRNNNIFGETVCYMCSIEWQKRGLPHAHILVWLKKKLKSNDIDSIISAELPDPQLFPLLAKTVETHMIHGPCGSYNFTAPCMQNRQCTKRFPRAFSLATQTSEDGYPLYRRQSPDAGGFTTNINGIIIDNRWVVPYNPFLSETFDAHINVEACYSVKSIKYICKYILKGSDLAIAQLQQNNEIDKYIQGRYICTGEAVWRIFGFGIHEHYPMIQQLSVHLENGQRVYFNADNIKDKVKNAPATTLTAFFNLCSNDTFAATLLYDEVPQYFTWKNGKFAKRIEGTPVDGYPMYVYTNAIGRVYTVHPTQRECFYLRMLLFKVRGPKSFIDLRTFNGIVYNSYHGACEARGMLANDNQWIVTLDEAVLTKHPKQIRDVFCIIIVYCQPSRPQFLYDRYKDEMAADILYKIRQHTPNMNYNDNIYNECLIQISSIVSSMSNGRLLTDFGLPIPTIQGPVLSSEYLRETSYNITELQKYIADTEGKLNPEQATVYDLVMTSVNGNNPKIFYLNAAGGTGKTTLMNLILDKVRFQGKIALALASSGIASTLLHGGKTVHAGLNVPLTPNPQVCSISKKSGLAQVLRDCVLIIWDECSMGNKSTLNVINNTLKDIRNNNQLMGGITVLLGGDFRQTLPVIQRGTRADVINASLKSSHLWHHVQILPSLQKNMRLNTASHIFSNILLELGNGTLQNDDGIIPINKIGIHVCSQELLIEKVWPDVANIQKKPVIWIAERAILAPLNATVDILNTKIIQQVLGEEYVYNSIDTLVDEKDITNYPTEFLNSVNIPGIPAHELRLKIGIPIMLLRNLAPPTICNGTRCIVKKLMPNLIEAVILTGPAVGETVLIPRIPLIPRDVPFQFKRLQFPVRICIAITINKAQGQSFNTVGVDLTNECFSHGQLYVACSRATNAKELFIYSNNTKTRNVVYPEIFY